METKDNGDQGQWRPRPMETKDNGDQDQERPIRGLNGQEAQLGPILETLSPQPGSRLQAGPAGPPAPASAPAPPPGEVSPERDRRLSCLQAS